MKDPGSRVLVSITISRPSLNPTRLILTTPPTDLNGVHMCAVWFPSAAPDSQPREAQKTFPLYTLYNNAIYIPSFDDSQNQK